ncbi:MAG: tetratricopeptide repeat protein [Armatimonadetes bacterium]|nr:tetratricopeptide repeat protein [Armatimonadota bacterium]
MDPLDRAVQELNEHNYGAAIRSLEMITARDPSNADAWKHLAQAYFRTERREEAAEAAQRYSALRPTDAGGHYNAGMLLSQLGQAEAAERALRAALAADPGHAKARRALAKLQGLDEETGEPASPVAAAGAAAAPPEDVRRKMPWQAKVAAGLTVLASVAILLWLFLPGGLARRGPQTQAPEPTPNPTTVPTPDQPSAEQPNALQTPTPAPQPQTQPLPDGTTPAPAPLDAPQQPLPNNPQPSAEAQGANPRGPQLFTPEEARRISQQIDQAHQREVAAAKGQIGQIAQAIRNLDEETWREGGRDSITLMTTQLLGSNASAGTLAALQMVATAETPSQAADRLEAYARTLPPALSPQQLLVIQQVLTQPNVSPEQAYSAIKTNFEQWGIGLLDGPSRALEQALRLAPGVGGTLP